MKFRIPGFVTSALQALAGRVMRRQPDRKIGPQDDPYLLRWTVFPQNDWFNIYLHQFLHDDDDRALHDHPFASLSIALSGEMTEIYAPAGADASDPEQFVVRKVVAGDVIPRRSEHAHRMIINTPSACTVFIRGPKVREWGFVCEKGWRHYLDYANPTNPDLPGRGCGD